MKTLLSCCCRWCATGWVGLGCLLLTSVFPELAARGLVSTLDPLVVTLRPAARLAIRHSPSASTSHPAPNTRLYTSHSFIHPPLLSSLLFSIVLTFTAYSTPPLSSRPSPIIASGPQPHEDRQASRPPNLGRDGKHVLPVRRRRGLARLVSVGNRTPSTPCPSILLPSSPGHVLPLVCVAATPIPSILLLLSWVRASFRPSAPQTRLASAVLGSHWPSSTACGSPLSPSPSLPCLSTSPSLRPVPITRPLAVNHTRHCESLYHPPSRGPLPSHSLHC